MEKLNFDIEINAEAIKVLIDRERMVLPRLGTRKLYYLIGPHLKQQGLKIENSIAEKHQFLKQVDIYHTGTRCR